MIFGYELLNFMPKQYLSNDPSFREYVNFIQRKKRNRKTKKRKRGKK